MINYCCENCFNDKALKQGVSSKADKSRDCDGCGAKAVLCVPTAELQDLFEILLDSFVEDPEGFFPEDIILGEFEIVSSSVFEPIKLLTSIIGEEFCQRRYRLRYNAVEYVIEWSKFKHEIISQNRFFPETSIYAKIFTKQDDSLGFLFQELLEHLKVIVPKGESLWRARISENQLSSQDLGAPPKDKVAGGRANPVGISYLYLANNIKTAIHEVRPSNASKVWVASCTPKDDLSLLDLTSPKDLVPILGFDEDDFQEIHKFIKLLDLFAIELSKPVLPHKSKLDYIPTQFICEYIKTTGGYDGLIFKSSFQKGNNIVLFSPDTVVVNNPSLYKVTATHIDSEVVTSK